MLAMIRGVLTGICWLCKYVQASLLLMPLSLPHSKEQVLFSVNDKVHPYDGISII